MLSHEPQKPFRSDSFQIGLNQECGQTSTTGKKLLKNICSGWPAPDLTPSMVLLRMQRTKFPLDEDREVQNAKNISCFQDINRTKDNLYKSLVFTVIHSTWKDTALPACLEHCALSSPSFASCLQPQLIPRDSCWFCSVQQRANRARVSFAVYSDFPPPCSFSNCKC